MQVVAFRVLFIFSIGDCQKQQGGRNVCESGVRTLLKSDSVKPFNQFLLVICNSHCLQRLLWVLKSFWKSQALVTVHSN